MIFEIFIIAGLLVILLIVLINVIFWPKTRINDNQINEVSVLIPVRNEAKNILNCLESVVSQKGIKEIIVYDDHSNDSTVKLVEDFSKNHKNIRLIKSQELPEGWIGKNFACYRLGSNARSRWLLFIDADTNLTTNSVQSIISEAISYNATLVSCWPGLLLSGFWEKLLMPMLNFFVFSIYPAPISFIRKTPSLGIAHGACMLFQKEVYDKLGGHKAVRLKIFEDTELARLWRLKGEKSICVDGKDTIKVRMYNSLGEIWKGFQKNFYPGFNSPVSFWLFILLHFFLFLYPFLAATNHFIYSSGWSNYYTAVFLIFLVRILLNIRFRYPFWSALLHPIAEVFLLALGISSWWVCRTGKGVNWKNRIYFSSKEQKE